MAQDWEWCWQGHKYQKWKRPNDTFVDVLYLEMSNTQFNNVNFLYRAKPSNQIQSQEKHWIKLTTKSNFGGQVLTTIKSD